MCGRYELIDAGLHPNDAEWLMQQSVAGWRRPPGWSPRDVRPTHEMPVIRTDGQGRLVCELRRWGFMRSWPGASGKLVSKVLINAVGEELASKRTFKPAFLTKPARCIVPMSAWYEWPVLDGAKQRMRISMPGRPVFAVAGLYEASRDHKTGQEVLTYTVVTVGPNHALSSVHDRAPLILQPGDYETWLDPDFKTPQALIEKYPDDEGAFSVEPISKEAEAGFVRVQPPAQAALS